MSFYKRDGEDLQVAPSFVSGPSGLELRAETHANHVYPVAGWYWFATLDEALNGIPKAVTAGMTITPMQAKLALLGAGLLDTVETMIAQSDRATQVSWAEASSFNRSSVLLNNMALALGLSSAQLDDLFITASKIEV